LEVNLKSHDDFQVMILIITWLWPLPHNHQKPVFPNELSIRSVWVFDFKKCNLKITFLNVRFENMIFKNTIKIFYVFKSQFFQSIIPNNSFSAISFKITLFAYDIAISNTL
jgi:hypothetical protein